MPRRNAWHARSPLRLAETRRRPLAALLISPRRSSCPLTVTRLLHRLFRPAFAGSFRAYTSI